MGVIFIHSALFVYLFPNEMWLGGICCLNIRSTCTYYSEHEPLLS